MMQTCYYLNRYPLGIILSDHQAGTALSCCWLMRKTQKGKRRRH